MAMVKPSDCLHNCLKEVHLEKFHRNFTERGLTNCDQLGCLPMEKYSQFGIVSMEDRKRLFSIIEIIKSVKADGILCQHGTKELDRKPEQEAVRKENYKPTTRINNLGFAPKKLLYSEHETRRDEGKAVVKPTNNYKVAVERSAEEDLKQKQIIKHGVAPGKNSDSPKFQCRKTLNFSDPDLYSDDDEDELPQQTLKIRSTQDTQTAVKSPYFDSTQVNLKTVISNGNCKSTKDNRIGSGDASDPSSRARNSIGSARNEHTTTRTTAKGEKACVPISQQNTAVNAAVRTRKTIDSSIDIASSRSVNSLPQSDRENTTSSGNRNGSNFINSKTNTNMNCIASNVSSATAFSSTLAFNSKPTISSQQSSNVVTKEFVSAPKHFVIDLKSVSSNDREKTMRGLWQHPSKNNFDKNHAYFPAPEPVATTTKPIHVEQIIHSGGYNYGVPDGNNKTQNTTPQTTDEGNRSFNGILYPEKIRVCVRKRPRNAKELKRNDRDVIRIRGQQSVVVEEIKVAIDLTKYIHQHVLKFDEVFGDKCTNQEVYERAVKPLITCVFDRGSAICFAFGQTGAGKTHTLMGSRGIPGMYQLAGEDLFAIAHSGRYREPLRLWVSFYEIYCGHLYDLLNKRKRLHVRENGKQKVCVAGLMENPVPDVNSLIKVISYGNSFRSRGSTGVNPHSSRSHALLQMDVRDAHDNKVGRLTFIDLAGSERASDATNLNRQTRIEGAEINQSLLALKECIRSIDQDSAHTPYRQSKLTHILRDSFLGNSQTVMIANVSPTQTACENTLNTLRYADRVQELRKEVAVRSRRSTSPTIISTDNHTTTNAVPSSNHVPSPSASRRPAGAAPSLFHPSDIQFSSTPLKNSATSSGHVIPPVDLSDILMNGAEESPIGGHKMSGQKSSGETKERLTPVSISPIGELRAVDHDGGDVVENRRRSDGDADGGGGGRGAVFSGRGSPGFGSLERKNNSREGGQLRNSEVEPAKPCTCKSEEDVTCSNDFDDDLLREHRRIKTHAELVISRVKSVIDQASHLPLPRIFSAKQESDADADAAAAPHLLFMETKACMENARDNIRDFLDGEKKSRIASEPATSLQRELGRKSVEEPDRNFHFLDEVLPDENHRPQEETNETVEKKSEGNFNSSNQYCDPVSASDCNAARELRSWAAILQDDAVKSVGCDAFSSVQPHAVSREKDSDGGSGKLLDESLGRNDDEVEDGNEEEAVEDVPSFVISKEVRLLQMKIQELKEQKSRLEREHRLFEEDQQNDCERFTQTFHPSSSAGGGSAASFHSKFPSAPSNSHSSVLLRASPAKDSTPDGDVAIETVDLKTSDDQQVKVTANGGISPDQNGNFTRFSTRDFPAVKESREKEDCPTNSIHGNHAKNLESEERMKGGEGRGQVRTIQKETHGSRADGIHFSTDKGTVLQSQFGGIAQDYAITTDDYTLKFSDELAQQFKISNPSIDSRQELGDTEITSGQERISLQDDMLRTTKGVTTGKFIRHENSAFTSVLPSSNESANNSQPQNTKKVDGEEYVHCKVEPLDIATTSTARCLSLPVHAFATTSFEPIKSFPVTPRTGSESETNELKDTKDWNNDDDDVLCVDQSNSTMLQEAAVLERTRTLLVTAHEDQLTAVTHLCKQEMSLLMAFRTGQMDYEKYMESIRDILRTKSQIIQALVEHINEFHTTRSSSS